MAEEQHPIYEAFPEHGKTIDELRATSSHFKRLSEEYADTVREIDRMDVEERDLPHGVVAELEKKRIELKEELFRLVMGV